MTGSAVMVGKDDQIDDLAKEGQLTPVKTKAVLNCPTITEMSGSSLSGS